MTPAEPAKKIYIYWWWFNHQKKKRKNTWVEKENEWIGKRVDDTCIYIYNSNHRDWGHIDYASRSCLSPQTNHHRVSECVIDINESICVDSCPQTAIISSINETCHQERKKTNLFVQELKKGKHIVECVNNEGKNKTKTKGAWVK